MFPFPTFFSPSHALTLFKKVNSMPDLYFSNYATGQTVQKLWAQWLFFLLQGEQKQTFAKNAKKLC